MKRIWWNKRRNRKFNDLINFTEDFSLFIKQCCRMAWSVERKQQKVKIQICKDKKKEE